MKIPVLMYHAVSPQITGAPEVNPVHIPLSSFAEQMDWLKANGYETLSTRELFLHLKNRKSTSKKVVLTFDDGYLSLLEHVTPVLAKNNYKATLFLTTAAVGYESYDILPHLGKSFPINDRPLTWDELKEMQRSGWDIEAHGHEHKIHNMLQENELNLEMSHCKIDIEMNLGTSCQHYSFPWGRYNSLCLKKLGEFEFQSGFSVQQGLVHFKSDIRRLPRIEVNRFVDIESFEKLVTRGYSSSKERYKNLLNNLVYKYPLVKDLIKKISDKLNRSK